MYLSQNFSNFKEGLSDLKLRKLCKLTHGAQKPNKPTQNYYLKLLAAQRGSIFSLCFRFALNFFAVVFELARKRPLACALFIYLFLSICFLFCFFTEKPLKAHLW